MATARRDDDDAIWVHLNMNEHDIDPQAWVVSTHDPSAETALVAAAHNESWRLQSAALLASLSSGKTP